MTLKEKVTDLCKKKGITVRELERRAGLKERTIQHWDKSEPSGAKLYAVANVLNVPIEELLSVYSPDLERVAYVLSLQKEIEELRKKIPATNRDGQLGDLEFAVSQASESQRKMIQRILNYSDDQIAAFLLMTQSPPTNQ